MNIERLAIIAGARTPFRKLGTDLATVDAVELGRVVSSHLLAVTGLDPATLDEVIFGCVGQPAEAMNLARVIALRSGIPKEVPAVTVHRNCASGLEALTCAHQRLIAGQGEIFLVGGTESMSQTPLYYSQTAARKFASLNKAKGFAARLAAISRFRPSDFSPLVGLKLGLTDPVSGLNMGETAEVLARENGITRMAQDAFALASHRKAAAAKARLAEEICPFFVAGQAIAEDNGVRENQSMEALAKLPPAFDRDTGSVTAGNSSQITDGAAALLVMSERKAAGLKMEPLGFLSGYAYTGCDPERMGLGPVSAVARAAEKLGLKPDQADIVELNEAFAAQAIAVLHHLRALGLPIPEDRLNPNGGAIALGHPVGATGARLILTSLLELKRREAKRALVTLCVGGGQGAALWLER